MKLVMAIAILPDDVDRIRTPLWLERRDGKTWELWPARWDCSAKNTDEALRLMNHLQAFIAKEIGPKLPWRR